MAERTGFLYPFLEAGDDDPGSLLEDLARSASAKWVESSTLRRDSLASLDGTLRGAAGDAAERLSAGGRMFAFGNGGSATDAGAFVEHCAEASPPLPARSLSAEAAVLTALANDIGVDAVFGRQLAACARQGDVAVAFSTSGGSTNVLRALDEARRLGVLTIGIVGYGGGATRDHVDHCLAVQSESVHRIQEAQTEIALALVSMIGREMSGAGASV